MKHPLPFSCFHFCSLTSSSASDNQYLLPQNDSAQVRTEQYSVNSITTQKPRRSIESESIASASNMTASSANPTSSYPGSLSIHTSSSFPRCDAYSPLNSPTFTSSPGSPHQMFEEPASYETPPRSSHTSRTGSSAAPNPPPSHNPRGFAAGSKSSSGYYDAIRESQHRSVSGDASEVKVAGHLSSIPRSSTMNSQKKISMYGRHSNDWLFGGFSVRETLGIKKHD